MESKRKLKRKPAKIPTEMKKKIKKIQDEKSKKIEEIKWRIYVQTSDLVALCEIFSNGGSQTDMIKGFENIAESIKDLIRAVR